jgi:hypothetical protein
MATCLQPEQSSKPGSGARARSSGTSPVEDLKGWKSVDDPHGMKSAASS